MNPIPYLLSITLAEGGQPFYAMFYAVDFMEAAAMANSIWENCEVRNSTFESI